MRALVQRVAGADVSVAGQPVARIDRGLLVYVGIAMADTDQTARKLAQKVADVRIFEDSDGKLNFSVQDARGGVLSVPNFTLMADTRKGNRPALTAAAPPAQAKAIFETFVKALDELCPPAAAGIFGANMVVRSEAVGPVNVMLDITS